jgi:hypothetical protein
MSQPESTQVTVPPPEDWRALAEHVLVFYTLAFDRLLQAAEQSNETLLGEVKRAGGRLCADVAYWHLSNPPQGADLQLSSEVIRPVCDTLLMVLMSPSASQMQQMPVADPDELTAALATILG